VDIDGVLFDVDGTLVDTTYLHAVTWAESLAQHGASVPTARVHRAIGMGTTELLDELLGPDRAEGFDEAASNGHQVLYAQNFGHLRALPGAVDLLRWCHERGLRTVLASSASQRELEHLTSVLDADDAIDMATSSADAEAGKPDPGIVLAALERAHLDPAHTVMIGDAVWDAHAARQAGVSFVGVVCGGTSEAELRDAGASEVWRDPGHLLANVTTSLLGNGLAS
jgi:HAD superfamily hydrolase (TIGR01509 family)